MKRIFHQLNQNGRLAGLTLICAFILLIWLPTLDSLFHWDKTPELKEKRKLAEFPAWHGGATGLRNFIPEIEKYFNDHFGFRRHLIRSQHAWKREFFQETGFPTVLIGKQGWLYFSGDQMFENCQGTSLLTLEQLQSWRSLLECRRDWLAQRGIHYIFVIAPDKHRIYPEYLPDWMVKLGPNCKLDQFFNYMKTNSTVDVLDLRPALLKAKKSRVTYFRTDTHWNQYGGFMGYQALINALSRRMPSLTPLSLDQFQLEMIEQPGGDLAVMIDQEQSLREKEYVSLSPKPPLQSLQISNSPTLCSKRWDTGTGPVITINPAATNTAIVFRDSFSVAWIPILGHNFNKVTYIWQHDLNLTFIENEKPNVIIDEILERYFCIQDPGELKQKEGWK